MDNKDKKFERFAKEMDNMSTETKEGMMNFIDMIMDAMVEADIKSAKATKKTHELSKKIQKIVTALLERTRKEDEEKSEKLFEQYIEVLEDIDNKLDIFIGEINSNENI